MVDMASGPGFVIAGFVVAGLVAGGVAVVTGAVGVVVVYSTGTCIGRGTAGGEGEGGRGGCLFCFLRLRGRLSFLCCIGFSFAAWG